MANYEVKNIMHGTEVEATLVADYDPDEGTRQIIRIHPWDRELHSNPLNRDRSVYLSIGWVDESGEYLSDDDRTWIHHQNSISNRDDFVAALLEVFPELKRA